MAGQKQIGWGKLVATALFTALFLVSGLIGFVPKAYAAPYDWVDATHITPDFTCQDKGDGNLDCFGSYDNTQCPNSIEIRGVSDKGKLLKNDSPPRNSETGIGACINIGEEDITIGATDKAPGGLLTTEQSNDANGTDPSLECHWEANPLTWILCPVVKGINTALAQLDNAITSLLTVDQVKIFETKPGSIGEAYHKAWASFRSIALAILVVAGLAMVIAQALGFEILDAYTIKKILPRLIIAVIGIALSWNLMEFFVGLTNDLGVGVRWLIYSPFSGFTQQLELGGGAMFLLNVVGGGAILALGAMGILSFVGTALLAIIIAFLVLIVRQLVIVVLVLFAPIAIACSILPNTQGVYKLWYESFTKGLMMFPIIVAFLATGKVFAVTAINGNIATAPPISQLIGYAAYVMPYFLIPFTFKLAGGALRTISGSFNDRGRGGFDRLRKFRADKVGTNTHGMKEGTRFRPTNALARGFNATTKNAALSTKAGLNPLSMRSRFTSAKAQHEYDAAEEIRTKNPDFALGAQDDRTLKAAQYGKGRAGIRDYLANQLPEKERMSGAELDTAVGIVERMQATGTPQAVAAAAAIQRFATGTGYNDEHGNFDYQSAMDSIKMAGGGDRALQGRLLGTAKGVSAQAGQLAFGGASYGTLNTGLQQSINGQEVNGNAIALNAFMSNDAVSISRARNPHVAAMTRAATDRVTELQTIMQSGTATAEQSSELGRLTAQVENFKETANMYAAPERQTIINTEVRPIQQVSREIRTESRDHYADPAANVPNPVTGEPLIAPPPRAAEYNDHRNARRADPNDPFNQERT